MRLNILETNNINTEHQNNTQNNQTEIQPVNIQPVLLDNQKPATIPAVNNPVMNYHSQKASGRAEFKASEYNLADIGRIEDTDSFVRQAFAKKVALMFKEGWDLVGPNPKTVQYIKSRLAQIQRASGIPTEELLRDIGSGIVKKSNTFLTKVRKTQASGGRIRKEVGKAGTIQPVAAYFIIPSETMEFKLSTNKLVKWRQLMPNGDYKEYSPKDIVHFYYDRKEGFVFGTPTLIPVIDDIRALRKIEENIELLVYQHLFPLFHYRVGTEDHPAGIDEHGNREIDVVRQEIQYMPTEGGIVTPERHEIRAIGAEGRALRADGYLTHFKKRVIAGLGISSVDLGDGDTTNRATSDNMSRNLIDGVKDLQRIIEILFKQEIIDELLLESTFGPSVLDEENKVELKFKEIDIDAQIKKETHMADQFAKDIITHDEARMKIGHDPIEMPDPMKSREEAVDLSKYPEWSKTRWKMFEEPKLLIQALDEPYSPHSQAVAENNSTEINQQGMEKAAQSKQKQEIELEKQILRTKAATQPKKKKKDSYLAQTFLEVKRDTIFRIAETYDLNLDWVATLIRTQMQTTIDRLLSEQLMAFRKGYARYSQVYSTEFMNDIGYARTLLRNRGEQYINKLTENVISALKRTIDINANIQDIKIKTRAVFESVEFRTHFIEDVEIRKAEALGQVFALRNSQNIEPVIPIITEDACDKCLMRANNPVSLYYLTLDDLPPYHANCNCRLPKVNTKVDSDQVSDTIIDNKDEEDRTLAKRSKQTKFVKCVLRTSARLRARHPNWDEAQIKQQAEASCDRFLDEVETEDAASLEECVKSVKQSLRKQHPDWDADKIKSSAFAICESKGKK